MMKLLVMEKSCLVNADIKGEELSNAALYYLFFTCNLGKRLRGWCIGWIDGGLRYMEG